MKITRSAFLYLDGKNATFAQCGSCAFGPNRCALMHGSAVSSENGSCGLYVPGQEGVFTYLAKLTRDQVGYVERQVRCENCKFFGAGHCNLYAQINRESPALFDLDEKVSRFGCCNANEPR